MRDAWWIEQELDKMRREEPVQVPLELPLPIPYEEPQTEASPEPDADRGVIVIEF